MQPARGIVGFRGRVLSEEVRIVIFYPIRALCLYSFASVVFSVGCSFCCHFIVA